MYDADFEVRHNLLFYKGKVVAEFRAPDAFVAPSHIFAAQDALTDAIEKVQEIERRIPYEDESDEDDDPHVTLGISGRTENVAPDADTPLGGNPVPPPPGLGINPAPLLPEYDTTKGGVKYDKDKLRYDLVPWDAMDEVVEILTYGAAKYADRNWEKGMGWGRLIGAAFRHVTKFAMGEDNDPETNKSHLAHAMCCLLFLLAYVLRKIGTDDRPKGVM